ncbi:polyketide biosynthesis acyl carrier protein [Bradyrhizobium sp. USDA 4524]|uniref:acyl carrier protein n=1 Tax=unclassified Bradyrhizobium TaxID=2631580 RepID=UPI00209FF068|nr:MULTISPECIES: acyl carrier protein [unclassified Bradyrhizobium]MCP1846017.1 polyketide biosynthesis acyl carrier protein [Bradyrhizobium sp. USDA 4538]MCP1907349.1 polyketide biosynthesis acyl carrier protein [Bradyrhizobium sp. USDA 4537]MCP1985135.1 polyketide biosynthesis acyl carrier protein [Bradyrhizobium sp. USDA 4539]
MTSEEIFNIITRSTYEVLPELRSHTLSRNDSFANLGANSMDRAEIIAIVLEELALRIQRSELFGPQNIGELADLLNAKLGQS